MATAQDIARRIRSNSSHSRESARGPVKATEPVASSRRRLSEGVIQQRPQSRCGQRPSSGGSLDYRGQHNATSEEHPSSQLKPTSSKSLDNADVTSRRTRMLQRQNATTIDPDMEDTLQQEYLPPRPPSQSSRPKSSKGRPRPRSGTRPRSQSGGSALAVDVTGNDRASLPSSYQPHGSFSKYRPLPSIGSIPSTASSSEDQYNISPTGMQKPTSSANQKQSLNSSELSERLDNVSLSQKRTVPAAPSENESDRIQLAVKLLDGSRHERWFRNSDTLDDVLAFAESISSSGLPVDCEICTNDLPRRVFNNMSVTLKHAGLLSRTVLHIQER